MHISDIALKNRRFTIIALAALLVNGLLGFITMPRYEDPVIEMKECSVVVTFPGASPEDIEDLIMDPLEEKLSGLEDIEDVESWAVDGALFMMVSFDDNANTDDAVDAVYGALTEAENEFPPGVLKTEVIRHSTVRVVSIQIAVCGDNYSYQQLKDYAVKLKDGLRNVPEVKEINFEGVQEQEIRVSLDMDRLAGYGLSPLDVSDRIAAANVSIPLGKVEIPKRKFNVTLGGDFCSIDDVRETIIDIKRGIPIKSKISLMSGWLIKIPFI